MSNPTTSTSSGNNNNNNNDDDDELQIIMPPLLLPETPAYYYEQQPPNLNGQHFKITCVQHDGYLDIIVNNNDKGQQLEYSGYLIKILEEISLPKRGNFTYELLPPSGFGSKCNQRLMLQQDDDQDLNNNTTTISTTERNDKDNNNNDSNRTTIQQQQQPITTMIIPDINSVKNHPESYNVRNFGAFKCGESDVNDRPISGYSTELYVSSYYITPNRLMSNKFTVPYSPPDRATLGMVGTATHIRNIPDLAQRNEQEFGYTVCAYENTAYMDNLLISFPTLDIKGINPTEKYYYKYFEDGTCDVLIATYPELSSIVLDLHKQNRCIGHNGMPVGVIGDPLEYGYNYFAFGVRDDLPGMVLRTLNYWMVALMACFPDDPTGACPRNEFGVSSSFSELYNSVDSLGGTGDECGYVQFPIPESDDTTGLSPGIIATIIVSIIALIIGVGVCYHRHLLKIQEQRMKKRFIQQLARNIDIGPSAHDISAEKLAQAFKHIGGHDGMISKEDLSKWMNDLHLDFLSERDFNRLWETMDMDGSGLVDPIDFFTFLSECGPQFKEVHAEYTRLPKSERVKLSQRRLTHIESMGEDEVQRMERRNDRISRRGIVMNPSRNQICTPPPCSKI